MTHFKVIESISRSFGLLGFCLLFIFLVFADFSTARPGIKNQRESSELPVIKFGNRIGTKIQRCSFLVNFNLGKKISTLFIIISIIRVI